MKYAGKRCLGFGLGHLICSGHAIQWQALGIQRLHRFQEILSLVHYGFWKRRQPQPKSSTPSKVQRGGSARHPQVPRPGATQPWPPGFKLRGVFAKHGLISNAKGTKTRQSHCFVIHDTPAMHGYLSTWY